MRALLLAAIVLPIGFLHADGGAVLTSEVIDDRRITVFSDPAVLRAGPADFSVLVQDAASGDPILNAKVEFSVVPADTNSAEPQKLWLPPCCSMQVDNTLAIPATHAAADNKLLYAANVILTSSGQHLLTTTVSDSKGSARLPANLTVLGPASPFTTYWPYLAFPPVAIALFALRSKIRSR